MTTATETQKRKKQLKKWGCLLVLLFIYNSVFAMSWNRESLSIRNYSGRDIILSMEFWGGNIPMPNAPYVWEQDVYGLNLRITNFLLGVINTNILRPGDDLTIIHYTPVFPTDMNYEKMYALPFMDKMRAIFKKLEIIYDDGKKKITLEDLGEKIIKKSVLSVGSVAYTLEIFDNDDIGKPASEW